MNAGLLDSNPTKERTNIGGAFFGQSSFANVSIVKQCSVVNAKGLVKDKKELQLFAPLACGIQTGSGTVINCAQATPKDVVCIMGLGGVDRIESRLNLAKELGATHVIDSMKILEGKQLGDVVKEIADGIGPTVTIDATGVPALIKAGVQFTRNRGKIIQVGVPPPDFKLEIETFQFLFAGKEFIGAGGGYAYPPEYVPKMIQWYREGRFPIDKLMKFMPADDFEQGLKEMHDGTTIKPVLLW